MFLNSGERDLILSTITKNSFHSLIRSAIPILVGISSYTPSGINYFRKLMHVNALFIAAYTPPPKWIFISMLGIPFSIWSIASFISSKWVSKFANRIGLKLTPILVGKDVPILLLCSYCRIWTYGHSLKMLTTAYLSFPRWNLPSSLDLHLI